MNLAFIKPENTLTKLFIILFILSFNLQAAEVSTKASACTQALNQADFAKAMNISNEMLVANPNNRDGLLCKGRALGGQGQYAQALIALEQSLTQAKTGLDKMISYLLIGNLNKENNKNAQAIASYEKSRQIALSEKNNQFVRVNHNLIGETQAQNNDLNAALDSYIAGDKSANNDNERADGYERLANTYSALGKHDAAIEYQVKALLMHRRVGTLDQFANASLQMGRIYVAAKEYANAEKAYQKLVQFSQENGGAYYEVKANIGLAQAKAASGDKAAAKNLLADAQKMAQTLNAPDLLAETDAAFKVLGN